MIEQEDFKMKLVIVSGRSGSGKTTALHVLEDAGYYCIDNLPAGLLDRLVEAMLSSDSPEHERVAVSIDARNMSGDIARFAEILEGLPEEVSVNIIYLNADDATLIKRFSETRRRHPLSNERTALQEAVSKEAELLEPISSRAQLCVDTSHQTLHELRDLIKKLVVRERGAAGMSVLFQSFGYKRGVPVDADLVFDVRCLPNPHWIPALRPHTGQDPEVIDFLEQLEEVHEMFNDLRRFLDDWLPRFEANNRAYMTVAIGCTGGQHRSVYLAERLYRHFRASHNNVQVRHRELLAKQDDHR